MNNSAYSLVNKVMGSRTGLIWIKGGGDEGRDPGETQEERREMEAFVFCVRACLVESDTLEGTQP